MFGKYNSEIDQFIPENVVLTETQQNYLQTVVALSKYQDKVKITDVADTLNKSSSAVKSAMKTLNSKGILETDASGVIRLSLTDSKERGKTKSKVSTTPTKSKKENHKTSTNNSKPIKEKDYVSSVMLVKSSDAEKFKGVHNVEEGCEWISSNGFWAIKVPSGYSYTMDTTMTGSSPLGGKSELEIQLTRDATFSKSLKLPFSLAIYPEVLTLSLTDAVDDLCSPGMQQSIETSLQAFNGKASFENAVNNSDISVKYSSQKFSNWTKVTFLITVSGSGMISLGEAEIDNAHPELWFSLLEMLVTIKKVPQDYGFYNFESDLLPCNGKMKFFRQEKLTALNGDKVPVPDEYKWSIDRSVISNRTFSIVPNGVPFWDGIMDQSSFLYNI